MFVIQDSLTVWSYRSPIYLLLSAAEIFSAAFTHPSLQGEWKSEPERHIACGVNICEHLELLGETDSKERGKRPAHTDGRFRATCLSMSHLQCDIRVWPGPLCASVSLSNSMRTNPETPQAVCREGSFLTSANTPTNPYLQCFADILSMPFIR